MKHKNTEDYYNEQSKESKFAPSFDNLSASAKSHWEREFDEYARNNKAIELEDGCAYQFEFEGVERVAKYHSSVNEFWPNGKGVIPQHCSNIVKLVPEVK